MKHTGHNELDIALMSDKEALNELLSSTWDHDNLSYGNTEGLANLLLKLRPWIRDLLITTYDTFDLESPVGETARVLGIPIKVVPYPSGCRIYSWESKTCNKATKMV